MALNQIVPAKYVPKKILGVLTLPFLLMLYLLYLNSQADLSVFIESENLISTSTLGRKPHGTQIYRCDKEFSYVNFTENSRSQNQEDENIVNLFFKGACGGTYIELGALDGIRFSNSHFFWKALKWHGILIEPNPKSYEQLKLNRPEDELFNYAICSQDKQVHFAEGHDGAISGVYEFMPLSFKELWHRGTKVENLQKIFCRPLHSVIAESSLEDKFIDFLSLDVEGGEYEVIKTINFDLNQFGLILYEADSHNPIKNEAMKVFLEKKGYVFRFHVRGSTTT